MHIQDKVEEETRLLLPTPMTNGNDRCGPGFQSAGIIQEIEMANNILPKEYASWDIAREKSVDKSAGILDETNNNSWGRFYPAIKRWESVVGREVPAPTLPTGKNGEHHLSSRFTEWMMGLPEGWVTNVGIGRNAELKACGNGVVPQQAMLALSRLVSQEVMDNVIGRKNYG